MRFLGFLFLSLVLSATLVGANFYFRGGYLDNFLDNQLVPTLATIIGFNIAAAIFLIGYLTNIEVSLKNKYFTKTKSEIKHNIYYLISSFFLSFLLLIFRPNIEQGLSGSRVVIYYTNEVLLLSLFFLALFAVYEIMNAAFINLDEKSD